MADTKHLRGLDKALRTFPRIQQEAAQALVVSLNKGVEEIAGRVRVLAPDDPKTPHSIAANVKTDIENVAAKGKRGVSGFRSETLSARVYIPNAPSFHARFLEFGTAASTKGQRIRNASGRVRRARRSHPGTTAQPFFFVAVVSLKKRVRTRVTRALRAAAKKVAVSGR